MSSALLSNFFFSLISAPREIIDVKKPHRLLYKVGGFFGRIEIIIENKV
jgi:hypothetical protein